MGCVSSKHIRKEIHEESLHKNGDPLNHVVSLTSSTYGVLKLDNKENRHQFFHEELQQTVKECVVETKKSPSQDEPSEIINAWELMEGLEEAVPVAAGNVKKSPKSRGFLRDIDPRSPLKFLNQISSPRKLKKSGGKENKGKTGLNGMASMENSPKTILKESNNLKGSSRKPSPRLWASIKGSPNSARCDSLRVDHSGVVISRRRSLGPLFDPELVASLEKEVSEEAEQVKKIVSQTPTSRKSRNSMDSNSILNLFEKKCPPGGENVVVIYTTTLRGIRKTFEDCNVARSIIESHNVKTLERDVSMHSAFKDELRGLMGNKGVKVPLVFVKGRLIGGADEIVKMNEEGKLEILLDGIARAGSMCDTCAGVRFVMCIQCNGSCKVLGEDGKKSVKCSECNENGLIQCPMCC